MEVAEENRSGDPTIWSQEKFSIIGHIFEADTADRRIIWIIKSFEIVIKNGFIVACKAVEKC